ncbi:hypothetical protein H4219_001243 [Mycoemilia scoparia]|uniref:Uncharacterized protein n=1 Tax=Mycoemilia scoparia TaxID=417184 RepID=A0A9W8A6F7_9FUNG|nr:hypothetical protein H4219_001243 [Mycoemilia scoparia]
MTIAAVGSIPESASGFISSIADQAESIACHSEDTELPVIAIDAGDFTIQIKRKENPYRQQQWLTIGILRVKPVYNEPVDDFVPEYHD